ncbi:hypothetical protein KSP40_PGU004851 [Platanthera guangdongensis]|uniref:Secreted protein n=1 Tax=Platanthera guangdongensis TaxID=2320717 RepID=A0ABR2N448_9ASPA
MTWAWPTHASRLFLTIIILAPERLPLMAVLLSIFAGSSTSSVSLVSRRILYLICRSVAGSQSSSFHGHHLSIIGAGVASTVVCREMNLLAFIDVICLSLEALASMAVCSELQYWVFPGGS